MKFFSLTRKKKKEMGCKQSMAKPVKLTEIPKDFPEPIKSPIPAYPNEDSLHSSISAPGVIRRGKSWVNPDLNFKENLAKNNDISELEKKFSMGKIVGEGITGQVRLCTSKQDGTVWAMKSLNVSKMDAAQIDELRAEIQTLRKLDHPNIISIMEVFESANDMCIILEHCDGGDLSQRRFATESDVASIVYQLAEAVSHCHHNNIVHRDLKMENIMFASKDSDSIRLIDFGLSKKFLSKEDIIRNDKMLAEKSRMMKTACGTAFYMAPEMLTMSYSEKADVWAIGVITYMLITGRPPFEGKDEAEVFDKVRRARISFAESVWKRISPEALEFTKALLTVDPEKRPSANDILSLPWLKNYQKTRVSSMLGKGSTMAKHVCDSLIRFGSYPLIKRAALMIVSHHLKEQDTRELRELFLTLDEDHSGELSFEEIQNMIQEYGGVQMTAEDLRRIFDEIDQNHTGYIHHTEFLAATLETRVKITGQLLNQAFDHMDIDGSGIISVENLHLMFGKKHSLQQCENYMRSGFKTCGMAFHEEGVTRSEFFMMMGDAILPSPSPTPALENDLTAPDVGSTTTDTHETPTESPVTISPSTTPDHLHEPVKMLIPDSNSSTPPFRPNRFSFLSKVTEEELSDSRPSSRLNNE